jgi:hypothetical protein
VASYIRFDHQQATHLLQHCSSTSHNNGLRLQKAKQSPRASPLQVGPSHMTGTHQLDTRQPSQPLKRPTKEASKTMSLKAPFQPPSKGSTWAASKCLKAHPFDPPFFSMQCKPTNFCIKVERLQGERDLLKRRASSSPSFNPPFFP